MQLKDIFQTKIIETSDFEITIAQTLGVVLAILLWIVLIQIGRKILRRGDIKEKIGNHLKSARRFFIVITTVLLILAVLEILKLDSGKILHIKILTTKRVDFMIYHLLVLYLIVVGTRFILALLETFFDNISQKNKLEKGKSRSIFLILKYLAYVIAITIFIESLGFSVTIVIASVSALLVGIGLGIQHFFNDIISGIVILFDHAIKVEDIVEIEGELIGKVKEINLRTSKLSTRDDVIMIIPNSMFTSEKVINWSHNTRKTRFEIKVGVAYGSNVRLVEKILIDCAIEHPDVNETPRPFVLFYDFGNSSLDFTLKFWSEKPFWIEPIKSDLRFMINQRFKENGVTIPFPQNDVYIKSMPENKA